MSLIYLLFSTVNLLKENRVQKTILIINSPVALEQFLNIINPLETPIGAIALENKITSSVTQATDTDSCT